MKIISFQDLPFYGLQYVIQHTASVLKFITFVPKMFLFANNNKIIAKYDTSTTNTNREILYLCHIYPTSSPSTKNCSITVNPLSSKLFSFEGVSPNLWFGCRVNYYWFLGSWEQQTGMMLGLPIRNFSNQRLGQDIIIIGWTHICHENDSLYLGGIFNQAGLWSPWMLLLKMNGL